MKRQFYGREDRARYSPGGSDAPGSVRFTALDQDSQHSSPRLGAGLYNEAHVDLQMPRETAHSKPEEHEQLIRNTPGQIVGAFAHTTMGGAIPTLLGMAVDRYRQSTADSTSMPGHGRSLSADSSAMVQNIRGAGVHIPVNPENPGAHQNNGIANNGRDMYRLQEHEMAGAKYIGDSTHPQVRAGAATARRTLAGARPGVTNTQQFGEQGRLF